MSKGDMSDAEIILKMLVTSVAEEVATSSIMQSHIAQAVKNNDKLIDSIVENIDPNLIARELARQVMHAHNNNTLNHNAHGLYAKLMTDARNKAADLIAEQIAKETMSV